MAVKFGKVYRNVVAGRPNMNDFSMVTVASPLQLFEKITFGECIAEFPLDLVGPVASAPTCRLQLDEDDDQVCDTVKGVDPAEEILEVDICREKATVDDDARQLVLAVADDRDTMHASSIEQAVGKIRRDYPGPVQMVQCELSDGRVVCAKEETFMMPCCGEYRGFVCLNTNDVCVVDAPPLVG